MTNCWLLTLRGLDVHMSCGLNLFSTRVMIFKPEVGGRGVGEGYQKTFFFK